MPSWRDDPAYRPGGVATEPARSSEPVKEKPRDLYTIRHMKTAAGTFMRAERFGLWRSRQWALAWLRALRDGHGREWLEENRAEFRRVLEADGWFEPMLTGADLLAGCEKVFEKKKTGLVKQ